MPAESVATAVIPFRRLATAPLVLLDSTSGAFGSGSIDLWAQGSHHTLYVAVHDLPDHRAMKGYVQELPLLATSALTSMASYFPGRAVDTAALTWYFLFAEPGQALNTWRRVTFAGEHPERIADLRAFPQNNTTAVFSRPEISDWEPPAAADPTDGSGDVMTYRAATMKALQELGALVDAALGESGLTQTWQGDHCIREVMRRRTLLVRRSHDLLQEDLAAFLAEWPEAKPVFNATLPTSGFHGIAVEEVVDHGPAEDWLLALVAGQPQREEKTLHPSWRGHWQTRVPSRHDLID